MREPRTLAAEHVVVVEKPFVNYSKDAEELIELTKKTGKMLIPFQSEWGLSASDLWARPPIRLRFSHAEIRGRQRLAGQDGGYPDALRH